MMKQLQRIPNVWHEIRSRMVRSTFDFKPGMVVMVTGAHIGLDLWAQSVRWGIEQQLLHLMQGEQHYVKWRYDQGFETGFYTLPNFV